MVIDTSALLAVLFAEDDAASYAAAVERADVAFISAVSMLELFLVVGARKREVGLAVLHRLLPESRIRVVPFDNDQLLVAREAWWRYGKGRHPAGLNLGDCCSYALAKVKGHALFYKGNDFGQTDLRNLASSPAPEPPQ